MRLALLSDVHANLHALEAVIATLERERPDRWVVAGDLVGYGPLPDECVARVLELDPVCVAGNHDLIAIGRLSTDRCVPLARESLEWTAATISPATREALAALPPRAEVEDVVVAHGSLDDPQEYVRTPEAAQGQLALLAERHPGARTLVIGHTHSPMEVREGGRLLVNPGAVGQSRSGKPAARAALLDTAAGTVRPMTIGYDVDGARAELRRRGLDPLGVHQPPAPFPGAYRLRRIARRLSSRRR